MSRTRFDTANCSIARAVDALGDWWTLLIIREAFMGTRRFADFEANLGIAKNILTNRLQHLVEHEILTKVDAGRHGTRYEYTLTPKGKDLFTVITALRQWGDRWVFGEGNEPIVVRERKTGKPMPRLRAMDERGKPYDKGDLVVLPGPGADPDTLKRFGIDVEDAEAHIGSPTE